MQLLLLNPNMSVSMTDNMLQVASRVASENTELLAATATRGFPYISSRAESQIAGAIALDMIAKHEQTVDGVIIAAFGDPGLVAARELFHLPVVGMAEASITTAALLGEQFSIVTFTPVMSRWYIDSVNSSGLAHRFLGVRTPAANALGAFDSQADMKEELLSLIQRCIDEDGADVVILGGAPLAGLALEIQPEVSALLLDPISCAVTQLESLVKLTTRSAFENRHSRPMPKTSVDLSTELAQCINRTNGLNTE